MAPARAGPGWIVAAREDSVLAKDFLDEAITRNGTVPHTVHADRGTSMTSKPVSALLVDLGVLQLAIWSSNAARCPIFNAEKGDGEWAARFVLRLVTNDELRQLDMNMPYAFRAERPQISQTQPRKCCAATKRT